MENSELTLHRKQLERKYASVIRKNPRLDRTLVSFQANKSLPFYGWFKFKEGFSVPMVHYLLKTLTERPGSLLDPFAGSGTALFASRDLGWEATGIELLPVGITIIKARQVAERMDPESLENIIKIVQSVDFAAYQSEQPPFRHITITKGAFPPETEAQLKGYLAYCRDEIKDPDLRIFLCFAAFCILEDISYTRKDGQYLRWDHRSGRIRGKIPFDKGRISSFKEALLLRLEKIVVDLYSSRTDLFGFTDPLPRKELKVIQGSCLNELCKLPDDSFDIVVTSPPYCNRYDYTRTYALELVLLGAGEEEVKQLRQEMLSCTVENRTKVDLLRSFYTQNGRADFFDAAMNAFRNQEALQEVLRWLYAYKDEGHLNNANIPRMVENYFLEMALVIFELARVLRSGGKVAMVNDNVRYAGEEVPVDLILSDIAEAAGLSTRHIWMLETGKGNSSQQMGKYGRSELRKCVYIWEKQPSF
jgi:hypothetical protein